MSKARLHGTLLSIIILILQVTTDAYILKNYTGERRTGVFIFLLIGDICLLLILRYLITWTVQELKTLRRACSIALWFLSIFITQVKTYFIIESLTTFCGYTGTEAEGCSIDRVEFDRCMNPVGQLGSGGGGPGGPGGGGGQGLPPNFNTASPDSILSNSKSIITNNKSEISNKTFSLESKTNTLINFQLNSILSSSNTCQCRIILDTKLKLDSNCMPCPFRNYDRNIFTFVLTIMYSSMFFILVNPVQLSKNIMNRIFEDNQINSDGDNKEGTGLGQNNNSEDLEHQNSDYEVPNANRNNNNNKVVFQTKTSRLGKDSHSHGSSCSQNKSQTKLGRSSRLKQQISNNLSFMSNNSNRTRTTETSSTSFLGVFFEVFYK